jgi:hypothetical protein
MSIWFRKVGGLNSDSLRQIARDAGVSWDEQTILHTANGIGYKNGDSADVSVIQDAAEKQLGFRPVVIDDQRTES